MEKEYFGEGLLRHDSSFGASCLPRRLYLQDRDWTCSVACLRTMMSGLIPESQVPSEETFIGKNNLTPGPYYSKDIKLWTILSDPFLDIRYGCDDPNLPLLDESDICMWLKDGWYVAINWMMSFDHWCVMLAVTPGVNPSTQMAFFFDPYYGDIRGVHLPDLGVMWRSGNTGLAHDYILMRSKS